MKKKDLVKDHAWLQAQYQVWYSTRSHRNHTKLSFADYISGLFNPPKSKKKSAKGRAVENYR